MVTDAARWTPILIVKRLSQQAAYKRIGRQFDADDNGLYLDAVPNPTNGVTDITVVIPDEGSVTLEAFNTLGMKVARISGNDPLSKGRHIFQWDTRNVPSGVYPIQLRFGNYLKTIRVVVMK